MAISLRLIISQRHMRHCPEVIIETGYWWSPISIRPDIPIKHFIGNSRSPRLHENKNHLELDSNHCNLRHLHPFSRFFSVSPFPHQPVGCVWKCCVPLNPMVFMIVIPIKWLFHWEYTQHFQLPTHINQLFSHYTQHFQLPTHIKQLFVRHSPQEAAGLAQRGHERGSLASSLERLAGRTTRRAVWRLVRNDFHQD